MDILASRRPEDVTDWLLGTLLPNGGYVRVEIEAYFDESGTHSAAPIMSIAGYLVEKEQARRLSREWRGELSRWGLPYFRMSECAHGNGPFSSISKENRIQIASRMIQLIKRRVIQGIGVTVNEEDFLRLMPKHDLLGRAYSFSAHVALAGVRKWIEHNPDVSEIAFFFESGHRHQSEANRIMSQLFSNKRAADLHRYSSHSFVDKKKLPILQAADLLAWHCYTDKRRQLEGLSRRKDFVVLLEGTHHNIEHLSTNILQSLADSFERESGGMMQKPQLSG